MLNTDSNGRFVPMLGQRMRSRQKEKIKKNFLEKNFSQKKKKIFSLKSVF
jgi:hypothetical protein